MRETFASLCAGRQEPGMEEFIAGSLASGGGNRNPSKLISERSLKETGWLDLIP